MSNPQPQSPPDAPQSQPQPQQQQPPKPPLLKVEDLSKLHCLTNDQKAKYCVPFENLWRQINTKPAGSPEHTAATAKLAEFSSKLIQQEKLYRNRHPGNQGQPAQSGQQNAQPNQQNHLQRQQFVNQQNQQSQQTTPQPKPPLNQNIANRPPQPAPHPGEQPSAGVRPTSEQQPQGQQPAGGAPALHAPANQQSAAERIRSYCEQFLIRLGPEYVRGSPDAEKKYNEQRISHYRHVLMMERLKSKLDALQRQEPSEQMPAAKLAAVRSQAQAEYQKARGAVDLWRAEQKRLEEAGVEPYRPNQNIPLPLPHQLPRIAMPLQNAPQAAVKSEPQIKVEGGQAPQPHPQPPMQTHQQPPAQAQPPPPPQHQQPPQFTNMPGGIQGQPTTGPHPPRQPPAPLPQQPMGPHGHAPFGQAGQQHPPQRPPVNPQQGNQHYQQQTNSPHPHSASSAGPSGHPVPYTHNAAVAAAQRSYSTPDAQRANNPMNHAQGSFPPPGNREREHNTTKFPISRNLNTTAPVPVSMGPARPTLSGPTNPAPGPMGQPVISKIPSYQLEGEGERVLNKRKLDEMVRQVTGGSEDALTPEVEEAMLSLADEFVDTVITSACKLAKLRESTHLEIRDLQLVLERNYNIRIPGYSSDEIRTVRRVHPAPGWTQKMNAVQAAKVMGGKTDI